MMTEAQSRRFMLERFGPLTEERKMFTGPNSAVAREVAEMKRRRDRMARGRKKRLDRAAAAIKNATTKKPNGANMKPLGTTTRHFHITVTEVP